MTIETDGSLQHERSAHQSDRNRSAGSDRRGRIRRGVEGGLLATVVMTAFRLPVTRSLPPTAEFWVQYVRGGDPDDHPAPALALHLLYGIGSGVAFAALLPGRESVGVASDDTGPPSQAGEFSATTVGLLYGLVLSVFGERFVLGTMLDTEPPDRLAFHLGHVVYALTLGEWVGTRTRDG